MTSIVLRRLVLVLVLALALAGGLLLPACTSFGPARVPPDQFNYNQAVARSANEQMLLNLVRLRYREVPVFLALNSVLTQYIWSGNAGVEGSVGEGMGFDAWGVGGAAGVVYIERPTITYTPLSGHAFAQQLLTPIPSDLIFALVQSGWPPRQLLSTCLLCINNVQSAGFEPSPSDAADAGDFRRMVDLIVELSRRGAIEMQRAAGGGEENVLVFEKDVDGETRALIDELKDTADLDRGHDRFRVTTRRTGLEADEVRIRVRSVLDLMGFLSNAVELPPEHLAEGRAAPNPVDEQFRALVPLRIRAQLERPDDAFVAVAYQGYWFYIPQADHDSKQAFGLLAYLFQFQAPPAPTAGPLLTVPTG